MNIYRHEFKMNLKSVITWSISISLLILVFTSMFTVMAEDAQLLNEAMQKFPKELLIAFGMDGMDMSTIIGFFSMIFLFIQIMIAIQAANYGLSMLSIEERELTADFLMAKPVGRTTILTSKLLAALTCLAITDVVIWLSSVIFVNLFKGESTFEGRSLLFLLLSIIPFQLFFLTLGMLISMLAKRIRSVTPYAMALAFGMYILSAFGGMLGESFLEVLTPFKHFDPNYIINNQVYDPKVFISLAVIAVSIVGTYVLYQKRNIAAPV